MWIEGEYYGLHTCLFAQLRQSMQDFLVTKVHTIKGAYGHNARFFYSKMFGILYDQHRVKLMIFR
jgi:hypothetical protein